MLWGVGVLIRLFDTTWHEVVYKNKKLAPKKQCLY